MGDALVPDYAEFIIGPAHRVRPPAGPMAGSGRARWLHPGYGSQLLGQKPQQPWHEEARVATGLIERVAQPIMSGALDHAAAGEKACLFGGFEERFRMRPAVDEVVLGAVGEQHRGLVVDLSHLPDGPGITLEHPLSLP